MKRQVWLTFVTVLLTAIHCLTAIAWDFKREIDSDSIDRVAFAGNNTLFYTRYGDHIYKASVTLGNLTTQNWVELNSNIRDIAIPQGNPHFVAALKSNEWVEMRYTSDLSLRGTSFEGTRGPGDDWAHALAVSHGGGRLVVIGSGTRRVTFPVFITRWDHMVWDFNVSNPTASYRRRIAHNKDVGLLTWRGVALSTTGNVVFVAESNDVEEWWMNSGNFSHRYKAQGNSGAGAVAAFEPYMVSGHDNGHVILWNYVSERRVRTFADQSDGIVSVTFSGNGDFFAAGDNAGDIYIYQIRQDGGILLRDRHFSGVIRSVESIALSHNAQYIAAAIGGDLYIGRSVGVPAAPTVSTQLEPPQVETSLQPNYPNPFNPETWIPYSLGKSAEVTVTIHAADGRLIRTLELGKQSAGVYQTKERAAYWNGKNEQGEAVASGVYFYTLRAGDFSATQKMLIRK